MELYLQCCTQQEIANKIGLTQGRVAQIIKNMQLHIVENPPKPKPSVHRGHFLKQGNKLPLVAVTVAFFVGSSVIGCCSLIEHAARGRKFHNGTLTRCFCAV